MALPVIASKSNSAYSARTSVIITKPTGLAVGDLLVAFIGLAANNQTITTPAGWTAGYTDFTNSGGLGFYYKVATSGDVAASNFTFTLSGSTYAGGALLRVTGYATGSEVAGVDGIITISPSLTFTHTCSSAPTTNESLILIAIAGEGFTMGAVYTTDSYTITPTTTLTEEYDFGIRDAASDGGSLAVLSGSRSSIVTTTSYSATSSLTLNDVHTLILHINAPQDTTGTNALLEVSPTTFTQAGSAGTTGTNTVHEAQPEFFDQSGRATAPTPWSSEAKPSTSWNKET